MNRDRVYRVNAPRVISESIEGELVMINLERGTYYSVEGSGDAIWRLVEAGLSHGEILAATRDAVAGGDDPGGIESAVEAFLGRLLQEELIVPIDVSQGPGDSAAGAGFEADGEFVAPVLRVYSDMADILLLDPVHDVAETGWPQPKPATEPS